MIGAWVLCRGVQREEKQGDVVGGAGHSASKPSTQRGSEWFMRVRLASR
jgi:hypothetical protein